MYSTNINPKQAPQHLLLLRLFHLNNHSEKARAHATKRARNYKFPTKKLRITICLIATAISIAERCRIAQKNCLPSRDRTAGLKITNDRCKQLQSCALPAELRRVGKRVIACWWMDRRYSDYVVSNHCDTSVLDCFGAVLVRRYDLARLEVVRRRRAKTARVEVFI
jgi:hypothetical protein